MNTHPKRGRKLSLSTETIRTLNTQQLEQAAGGISRPRNCNFSQVRCDTIAFSNCQVCTTDTTSFY